MLRAAHLVHEDVRHAGELGIFLEPPDEDAARAEQERRVGRVSIGDVRQKTRKGAGEQITLYVYTRASRSRGSGRQTCLLLAHLLASHVFFLSLTKTPMPMSWAWMASAASKSPWLG